MARYRAILAYDGTAYCGFQRQAEGLPTIQSTLEEALEKIARRQVIVYAAGRTDTGVHAVGQVVAFDLDWDHGTDRLLLAINALLPEDIVVCEVAEAPEQFHPRFDAQARVYSYDVLETPVRQPLLLRHSWQIFGKLDAGAMQSAAGLLVGTHDFATFGHPPKGDNTVRRVHVSEWEVIPQKLGRLHRYHIEATAFLHHMVRRIVGLLVEVGRGTLTVEEFERAFRAADLRFARRIAPPQGLTLETVRYPQGFTRNRQRIAVYETHNAAAGHLAANGGDKS